MAVDDANRANYHHGELPKQLMGLALEQIEREGTEKLSLRALARTAGVSQTAPYRHFPTKQCLFAAIATEGFIELKQEIKKIVESSASLEERFMGMGLAYVEYALANPTKYHLMFGSVLADFSAYQMLQDAAQEAYAQVRRCEAELLQSRQLDVDAVLFGGVIWAGVHGIASLLLVNRRRTGHGDGDTAQALQAMRGDIEGSLNVLFGHLLADH